MFVPPASKLQMPLIQPLQLVFLVSKQIKMLTQRSVGSNSSQTQLQHSQVRQILNANIDFSLLDFINHHQKSIYSSFQDVQIQTLIICPKLKTNNFQFQTTSNWAHLQQANAHYLKYWFAAFLGPDGLQKYLKQPVQLISIIIKISPNSNKYLAFIGYAPGSLNLLEIIYAMSKIFSLQLTNQWIYFTEQDEKQQIKSISNLAQITVSEAAGHYIKVCGFEALLPSLDDRVEQMIDQRNQYRKENTRHQEIMYMDEEENRTGSPNWQSNITQVQTCFQLMKESRNKLISLKSMQELQKLKGKALAIIANPSVKLPRFTEEQINSNMKQICEQLQANIQNK